MTASQPHWNNQSPTLRQLPTLLSRFPDDGLVLLVQDNKPSQLIVHCLLIKRVRSYSVGHFSLSRTEHIVLLLFEKRHSVSQKYSIFDCFKCFSNQKKKGRERCFYIFF